MKIVSWNCNGGLRNKVDYLNKLNADLLIIQECEDPAQSSNKDYQKWASNHLWLGLSKHRGIGVFARDGLLLKKLNWDRSFKISFSKHSHDVSWKTSDLKLFLPFEVEGYLIIAVWTKGSNKEVFSYIGQFWKFLQIHRYDIADRNVIISGDFNSNVHWEKSDRWWNHSDVVRELAELKIHSLYHTFFDEDQGCETQPTFYMQRKLPKPYHIDYAFCSSGLLGNSAIEIGKAAEWLKVSDHMPLIMDIKDR